MALDVGDFASALGVSKLVDAGTWDASSGSFPERAVAGTYYVVSNNGTVDGVAFEVNDWLVPLVSNGSTSTFAGNWEISTTARGVLTPMSFGAAGDGVTDDTAALTAMFDFLRTLSDPTFLLRPWRLSGMGRKYKVTGSINATMITLGKGWGLEDFFIIAEAAGKTVLDLSGSRFGYHENVNIWGVNTGAASTDTHTGILIACADVAGAYTPCDTHNFVNCSVDGYFSHSAYTDYGSEITNHSGCSFKNRRVSPSGTYPAWAVVLQGRDTVEMVSDFVTIETGRVSYTVKHFDTCLFQKPFGIAGPTLYIEDISSTRFTKPYVTNGSGEAIHWKVSTDYNPYAVVFDGLQIETTGTTKAFLFSGSGSPTILGLDVSFGNIFSSTSVFETTGVTTLALYDANIRIPRWNASKPTAVFATTSTFKIDGNVQVPVLADLEARSSFSSFTGTVRDAAGNAPVAYVDEITFGSGAALSHYEEGTWTPTVSFGGGSTGVTYSLQTGTYTRIGRLVTLQASITLTSNGSDTGDVAIGGVPFAAAASSLYTPGNILFASGGSGLASPSIRIHPGSLIYILNQGTTGFGLLTDTNVTDTAAFRLNITYLV